MDLREAAAAYGRLAGVAVLAGLAVLGLASRPGDDPVAPSPVPGGAATLTVLVGLAIPAALLAALAALRMRRWWVGVLVLLGMLVVTVTTAALASSTRTGQASPPNAPSAATPPPAPGPDPRWLPVAVGVLLVLLVVAALAGRRRPAPDRNPPAAAEPAAPGPPAHRTPAAVVGRRATPRTAIIRCYAAMEGALTAVPAVAPHAADSPSEVLDRALAAEALHSPGAWRLVELFDEARFSRHRMTEFERQEAEAALQVIFDELRSRR